MESKTQGSTDTKRNINSTLLTEKLQKGSQSKFRIVSITINADITEAILNLFLFRISDKVEHREKKLTITCLNRENEDL